MKQLFRPLVLLLFLLAAQVQAAPGWVRGETESHTATGSTSVGCLGCGSIGFQVTGTWTATITFESTLNGSTWVAVPAYNQADGSSATTTTGNGIFLINGAVHQNVRARVSAYTSGTINIMPAVSLAQAVNHPAGAVSSNVGILTFPDNEPFNLAQVGGNTVVTGGTSGSQGVGGLVAHDAAAAGNPVLMGARARTTDPTAVSSDDASVLMTSLLGKLVNMPHCPPGERWSYAAASGGITNATALTIKAAAGAGIKNCIHSLQLENTDQQDSTEFSIRDGSGGAVLWRWKLLTGGHGTNPPPFQVPICGSANTLLEVIAGTTGTVTFFNAQGCEEAE